MSEWNANWWSSAGRSLLWWNVSRRCDECIERFEELCYTKRPRLAVGHRQYVVARITRLAGAKTQLEWRFVHVGDGYTSRDEKSLIWREIDAAFESSILMGAVVNVNYIEPRLFLEDAREIVLERVWNAVERLDSVKVNITFNGEFATKNKRANKSVITKNIENISIHRFARVLWAAYHQVHIDITRRVPGTRQRLGIVTYQVYKYEMRFFVSKKNTLNSEEW